MIQWDNGAVTIFQSELYQTTSTIVQTPDLVLIADPCWLPGEVEEIRRYVDKILGGRPLYLLFTHSDYDHIIGYRAFPGAIVIGSRAFAAKSGTEREEILEQIRAFDDEYYLRRSYEIEYPEVDCVISQEGEILDIGSTRLVFYGALGHNEDGMFTMIEPQGIMIMGDYLSDVEFPYIYHDSRLYEETIMKLDGLMSLHEIRMFVPGHGQMTQDAGEMKRRQLKDLKYIHDMRKLVESGDQSQIDLLIEGCPFPRNMRKFHRNNRALLERELTERG
jgi:hydroxyacylglutathione hydrolase